MNNEKEKFDKNNINCLTCIYDVHHLNPYIMGFLANRILQVLVKKQDIIKKIG